MRGDQGRASSAAVLLYLAFLGGAQAQTWAPQVSGTSQNLQCVHFASESTGWVVGDSGTILKSSGSGFTWTGQNPGISANLYAVFCTDSSTAWAAGENGTIIRTADGGQTWRQSTTPTNQSLYGLFFLTIRLAGPWAIVESSSRRAMAALNGVPKTPVPPTRSAMLTCSIRVGAGSWDEMRLSWEPQMVAAVG